jgi:hypothetical protein
MSSRKDIQAKHIPDRGILLEIRRLRATPWSSGAENTTGRRWVMLYELQAAPAFPEKVVRAKLAALIRRGLLSGCTCGCRGDFEITAAGEALLDAPQPPPAPTDTGACTTTSPPSAR